MHNLIHALAWLLWIDIYCITFYTAHYRLLNATRVQTLSRRHLSLKVFAYYSRQSKTKDPCVRVRESRQAMLMMAVELSCLQGLMGLYEWGGGLGALKLELAHKRPPNRATGTLLLHISTLYKTDPNLQCSPQPLYYNP